MLTARESTAIVNPPGIKLTEKPSETGMQINVDQDDHEESRRSAELVAAGGATEGSSLS